ncbi:MAG: TGS domain-containing protein, partial [Desulforhabdus sp.]|nr:TGS domain-containing protein [Desulforhabdus sp.]
EPAEEDDLQAFLELSETPLPALGISTLSGQNLPAVLQAIYSMSGIIRVYTKAPGKEANMRQPFVHPKENTLEDLATKIHKDFAEKLKFAKVWGQAVYDGQMVQRDYVLRDGDVVEIHL